MVTIIKYMKNIDSVTFSKSTFQSISYSVNQLISDCLHSAECAEATINWQVGASDERCGVRAQELDGAVQLIDVAKAAHWCV